MIICAGNVPVIRRGAGCSFKVPCQPIQVKINMSNLQMRSPSTIETCKWPDVTNLLVAEPRISPKSIALSSVSTYLTFLQSHPD